MVGILDLEFISKPLSITVLPVHHNKLIGSMTSATQHGTSCTISVLNLDMHCGFLWPEQQQSPPTPIKQVVPCSTYLPQLDSSGLNSSELLTHPCLTCPPACLS